MPDFEIKRSELEKLPADFDCFYPECDNCPALGICKRLYDGMIEAQIAEEFDIMKSFLNFND